MNVLPAARIVAAVADAAERWHDADFPPRVRATHAVMQRTGYTEPVVDYALDRLFEGLTRYALTAAIDGELGSLDALDGFVARRGRPDVWYRGLERAAIVSSQTTLGVAIPPLCYALCAKGGTVVVKDRSDRLVTDFVATLLVERPDLAPRVRIETWSGHDDPAALAALAESDVVVAFAGDAGLRAIRDLVRPDARFVAFGHRTSAAYVERETLASEESARAAADGIARDALLYDGEGCLSPHAAFVERGGARSPEGFAALLACAFDAAAIEFPASDPERAPATAAYADAARFRAAQGLGSVRLAVAAPHIVVLDQPREEPVPLLPRALGLYSVDGPDEAAAFLARHALPLEALALAPPVLSGEDRSDVLAFAAASGAARLTHFGALQRPSLSGEHGGTPRILPFVRALVRETSREG